MKRFFKILAFLGVAVVAIAVAGVAIIKSQDFNAYRSLIAEQVEAATGRKLTIDGDLELELSLKPALSVEGVTFANASWGTRPAMTRLERLAAVVELMPLLTGDVRVEWLEMVGVDVLLETNAAGEGNWVFENAAQDSSEMTPDTGETRLPVVKSVRLENVTLTYRDGIAGTEKTFVLEEVGLSADGVDSPMKLSAEASLDGEEIEIEGALGSISALLDNKVFPLKIEAEALGAEIQLDGSINKPRAARGYNLSFSAKGKSLKDVAGRGALLAGADALPLADRAFAVSGLVRDDGDRIVVDDLSLKIGETDLSGSVSLVPASPRLGVLARLQSSRLALNDLVEKSGRESAASPPSADGRVFPDDPLPVDALRGVDATVELAVGKLELDDVALDDLSVDLKLSGGRLILRPFAVTYQGNAVAGAVDLNTATAPSAFALQLAGKGIDYGKLIAEATGDATLQGQLDMNVDVAGKGGSVRAIMASLNGDVRIVTENGRIESGALGFMSGDLLGAVPFLGSGEDSRTLKCGVIDFAVKDGIAAPRALLIETGGLNVVGSGEIDLRDETLNLLFDPRAKNTSLVKMAEVGVRVTGTFLQPEFGPDAGSVVKNVTSTALGIATGGLSTLAEMAISSVGNAVDDTDYCAAALSGKMSQNGSAAQPAAQESGEPASNPLKGIGGALDNLFGN
ncbi:MAG: AsmA family protein [Rhodospirillales bacterium]